ncbi:hypothetical protein JOB18_015574 [Solea senegalensis]|uniref:Uncharacterized protein n=1 Tax=Solea senegalensis TaxID=28829 RepID=A0AAV6PU00_SOLSE|nr:hypothetical protein JOB18_015574 [Solea senegalensis]
MTTAPPERDRARACWRHFTAQEVIQTAHVDSWMCRYNSVKFHLHLENLLLQMKTDHTLEPKRHIINN